MREMTSERFTREDIARVYGLDPDDLDTGDGYATAREQAEAERIAAMSAVREKEAAWCEAAGRW